MTPLQNILASYRSSSQTEREKGTYFEELIRTYFRFEASYPPPTDGKQPEARHIEVKGRVKGATTVTITRNEMLYALNQSEKFHLAIVLVSEADAVEGPFYLQNPFDTEPGWGVSSVNYELAALLSRAMQNT